MSAPPLTQQDLAHGLHQSRIKPLITLFPTTWCVLSGQRTCVEHRRYPLQWKSSAWKLVPGYMGALPFWIHHLLTPTVVSAIFDPLPLSLQLCSLVAEKISPGFYSRQSSEFLIDWLMLLSRMISWYLNSCTFLYLNIWYIWKLSYI